MTAATLALSAAAITVAINFLTSFLKIYVFPRWGKAGVQVIVAALAAVGATYYLYLSAIPSVNVFLTAAFALFSMAVTFYEVIWSHVPLLTGEKKIGEDTYR